MNIEQTENTYEPKGRAITQEERKKSVELADALRDLCVETEQDFIILVPKPIEGEYEKERESEVVSSCLYMGGSLPNLMEQLVNVARHNPTFRSLLVRAAVEVLED